MKIRIKTEEIEFEIEDKELSHYDYKTKEHIGFITALKLLIEKVADESIKIANPTISNKEKQG